MVSWSDEDEDEDEDDAPAATPGAGADSERHPVGSFAGDWLRFAGDAEREVDRLGGIIGGGCPTLATLGALGGDATPGAMGVGDRSRQTMSSVPSESENDWERIDSGGSAPEPAMMRRGCVNDEATKAQGELVDAAGDLTRALFFRKQRKFFATSGPSRSSAVLMVVVV